jgi:hypothetical protein
VTADRVFLSGDGANFEGFPIPTGIFTTGEVVFLVRGLVGAESAGNSNSDRRQSGGAQWG